MRDNRRLVWLDEALKVITPEGATQLPDVQLVMLMTARKKLKNLPTANAVEVKSGKPAPHYQTWCNSDGEPVTTLQLGYECPFCGDPDIKYFCPNCGAKMDGVRIVCD